MRTNVKMRYRKLIAGEKRPDMNDQEEYLDVDAYPDMGAVMDEKTLVVDIDNVERTLINNIIDKFKIKTQIVFTDRGAHFYFDRPSVYKHRDKYVCRLGIEIEVKKKKKKADLITIRRNGETREILNEGVRETLPEIFLPIVKKGNGLDFLCVGVGAGDRNSTLFRLHRTIKGEHDSDRITRFVNQYLFDEPMDDQEVDNIIDSAEKYSGNDEGSREYNKVTELIKELRPVLHNGVFYIQTNDNPAQWTANPQTIMNKIWTYCAGETNSFVNNVRGALVGRTFEKESEKGFPIRFRNGLVSDGEFDYDDDGVFSPYYLDIEYDPNAPAVERVDDYIHHLTGGEPEYRDLLLEMLGTIFITNPETKKAIGKVFIMLGDGGNGKGTFVEVVRRILGDDVASGVAMEDLTDPQQVFSMIGKLVNLGDDIEDTPINNKIMKPLKNISTCDPIQCRQLYHSPVMARLTPTLIFTSNHQLKSFEKGDSWKRRVMWLPMFTKVKKKERDFITKLTTPDAIQYWVRLMIEGYIRLYDSGNYTESKAVNEKNQAYHIENDNTIEYVEERGKEFFEYNKIKPIMADYEKWCEEEYHKPLSSKKLRETLQKIYGLDNTKIKRIPKDHENYEEPYDVNGKLFDPNVGKFFA